MAKTNTKQDNHVVSTEELERIVSSVFKPTTKVEWNGIELEIKNVISLQDMLSFVRDVVDNCFTDDTGEYIPEVKDFAMRCAVLEYYGNFSLPEDVKHKYELVYGSDAIMVVLQHIDKYQYGEMMSAIDKKIAHRAQSNIEALTTQMNEAISAMNDITDGMASIFGGIDNSTVTKIADAIANGAFDQEKLLSAFMEKRKADTGEQ